jgi:hypothetical protein
VFSGDPPAAATPASDTEATPPESAEGTAGTAGSASAANSDDGVNHGGDGHGANLSAFLEEIETLSDGDAGGGVAPSTAAAGGSGNGDDVETVEPLAPCWQELLDPASKVCCALSPCSQRHGRC